VFRVFVRDTDVNIANSLFSSSIDIAFALVDQYLRPHQTSPLLHRHRRNNRHQENEIPDHFRRLRSVSGIICYILHPGTNLTDELYLILFSFFQ